MSRVVHALVVAVFAISVVGCTVDQNDPVALDTTAPGAPAPAGEQATEAVPPAGPETFAVGQPVGLGDWTLFVHGVTDPFDGDEFFPPAEGMRYVLVDAEVGYNGSDPQVVSTLICFELQDDQNRAHTQALVTNPVGDLDGDIAAGAARRGGLVYEVPADAAGLRLNFKCDLLSTGAATVALS